MSKNTTDIVQFVIDGRIISVDFLNPISLSTYKEYLPKIKEQLRQSTSPENKQRLKLL